MTPKLHRQSYKEQIKCNSHGPKHSWNSLKELPDQNRTTHYYCNLRKINEKWPKVKDHKLTGS